MIKNLSFVCVCWPVLCAVAGCYRSEEPASANVPRDASVDAPTAEKVTVAIHVKDMCDRLDLF